MLLALSKSMLESGNIFKNQLTYQICTVKVGTEIDSFTCLVSIPGVYGLIIQVTSLQEEVVVLLPFNFTIISVNPRLHNTRQSYFYSLLLLPLFYY